MPGKRRSSPTRRCSFSRRLRTQHLELVDIAAVAKIAKAHDILSVVDNVFATPMLQRPLALGADIVVYSTTKHIDGQGRCLGGAVLGTTDFVTKYVQDWVRQTGPSLSPFNAWVMLKGLETLPIRVKAQCESAAKVADHLAGLKGVTRVLYPGRADHPQAAACRKANAGRRANCDIRSQGRQRRRISMPQCADIDQDFEQPRRRKEPCDTPRDDDPPAHGRGPEGRTWYYGRHDPPVRRPGSL